MLMRWIKDEHQAKKGCPLPDEDEWELVSCDSESTPQQLNGKKMEVWYGRLWLCLRSENSSDFPLIFYKALTAEYSLACLLISFRKIAL